MSTAKTKTKTAGAKSASTEGLATERPPSFNAWFISLPEGRQAILREDKWMLAQAAFDAGMNLGTAYAFGRSPAP